MALIQDYHELWFESFELTNSSGHRDKIALRLKEPQKLPSQVTKTCKKRGNNPFQLLTECSRSLFYDYPVGTKFLLKTKLTDKEGGGQFFYTHYKWKPLDTQPPKSRKDRTERKQKRSKGSLDHRTLEDFQFLLLRAAADEDVARALAEAIAPLLEFEHELDASISSELDSLRDEIDGLKKILRSV